VGANLPSRFISLVVPFGAQLSSIGHERWRAFEYTEAGRWAVLDPDRIHIFDDVWLPSS